MLLTLQIKTLKLMDPVLKALEHYRTAASPSQKAADLSQLEKECLSTVDAYQYVCEMAIPSSGFSSQQELTINYNLNPDYNLDFSLSTRSYAYRCCICI